ncbi:B-4DMT family transporter [Mycolicibacterium sp.]|uniref:B-4DMT family transporter n=1 Tax=Mycolicibacterium sp. TaxID=2320850 RepID=UPI0025F43597|nr:B-4DMT family transporter [Mycolicibacterium sp.]
MTIWLRRGLIFAVGMVLLRLAQGALINANPTNSGIISVLLMLILAGVALVWGWLDGRSDAEANPDPDRRRDLAMRWLMTGLLAGVAGGVLAWLISLFYRAIYADGLFAEVTAFAAFTALLIFLPAMISVTVGRLMVDRKRVDEPRRVVNEDGTVTDVFDTVHDRRAAVASGQSESWLRDSREAVREVHDTVQQAKYDLNRTTPDDN